MILQASISNRPENSGETFWKLSTLRPASCIRELQLLPLSVTLEHSSSGSRISPVIVRRSVDQIATTSIRLGTIFRFPSEAQIQHVIECAPGDSPIERRNRALIAFAYATGARCDVLASISIRHVDLEEGTIFQDARSVRTKFRKSFTSVFFPVGDRFLDIIRDWIRYLIEDCQFGPTDPLFPPTMMERGKDGLFSKATFSRSHWKQTNSIRTIFRKLFEHAGLPYYHPHSFRDTLVQKGERECPNHEAFKAWSQNLGHEHVATTQESYAPISLGRRRELLRLKSEVTRSFETEGDPPQEVVDWVLAHIRQRLKSEL